MSPQTIRERLTARPFLPFRLVMTDGTGYEIRHPDLVMLGRDSAIIGVTADPESHVYDRAAIVALLHVVRLELLAAVAKGNGEES